MAFTTHSEYIASNTSEKIVLAHIHATKRLFNFTVDGSLVSRTTSNLVNSVTFNDAVLTSVASSGAVTDDTKYFFDIPNSKLYLFAFDQESDEVIVEFRLFFSNIPLNLSWDLQNGSAEVEYEPRIASIPKFKSVMTQGKKGNSLIGSGSIKINNNDGEYDAIFDNMFFDNADCNIYTYNRDLTASEAQIIFRGVITGKSFKSDAITFKVKDDLFKLDARLAPTPYGTEVRSSDATRQKRVLYGKVDNVVCQSLDQYNTGIALTGTLFGVTGNEFITGTGTSFLSELSENDMVTVNGSTIQVVAVKSDTLILVNALTGGISGSATVFPDIQFAEKNREFQVAEHAVKKYTTTVSAKQTTVRYDVVDATGFEAGDTILIDAEEVTILRVDLTQVTTPGMTVSTLVLTQPTVDSHGAASTVSKLEIDNVRYGVNDLTIPNDEITISNLVTASGGTKITFSADAEINAGTFTKIREPFRFFNGVPTVYLGTPAVNTITTVAQVSASLNGLYFTMLDAGSNGIAFWFNTNDTPTLEPIHGLDDSFEVLLSDDDLTASQVASELLIAIQKVADYYKPTVASSVITIRGSGAAPIPIPLVNTSTFTMASVVTGVEPTSKIDLSNRISPRDWIRFDGSATLYEVLCVRTSSVELRTSFAATDRIGHLEFRDMEHITDTTKVYLNCAGKTVDGLPSGALLETTSEVVKDILTDIGLSGFLDDTAFDSASSRALQLVSLAIPETVSGSAPTANKVINDLNKGVFGSLYVNQDLDLGYDILDTDTSVDTLRTITEHDLIDWSLGGDSFDLIKQATGSYRPLEFDPEVNGPSTMSVTYTSDFVTKYIGNTASLDRKLFLYKTAQAQEAVEREVLINSLSNSTIKMRGSLNLSTFRLGERVIMDLERLYNVMGSSAQVRIGVITAINNTGTEVNLEVEDMGGLYARGGRMAEESATDYSDTDTSDLNKIVNTYVTGENSIVDTDENTFGINLIQ